MQSNKAQITIFIILGLIILVGFAFVYQLNFINKTADSKNTAVVPAQAQPLKIFIESCLKSTMEDAVVTIGLQGGYYARPDDAIDISDHFVPVYFFYDKTKTPELHDIETGLSSYVLDNIGVCLDNLSIFRSQGYEIEQKKPNISVNIGKNRLQAVMAYPVEIEKSNKMTKLDMFASSVNFDFMSVYNIIAELREEQDKLMNYIPIGGLTEIAHYYNISYDINYVSDGIVIYTLIFNNSQVNNEPYLYLFGGTYRWNLRKNDNADRISIENISDQTAYIDYEFTYDVKTDSSNISYSDYSSLFDINETTGRIRFIPGVSQQGKHIVVIKAQDNSGNYDTEMFELDVVGNNNVPYIDFIPTQSISSGNQFIYDVNATGDNVFYLDDSELFDIDILTGLISFTPEDDQKGDYCINITAVDESGQHYTRELDMVIS